MIGETKAFFREVLHARPDAARVPALGLDAW